MWLFRGIFGLGLLLVGVGLWYVTDNYSLYNRFGGEASKWWVMTCVGVMVSIAMNQVLSELKFETWQSFRRSGRPVRIIAQSVMFGVAVMAGIIVILFVLMK